jgi:agmatinase
MKHLISVVPCFVLIISTIAHNHDHQQQMPLDYVKYPYQASYYPGDGEGTWMSCFREWKPDY